MSDPNLQRADGCNIFATFIVALLLVPAFYFIQKLVEGDPAPSVTQDVTDQRLKKIKVYLDETSQFNRQVETFHTESNSSLESVMQEVVDRYETNQSAP